MQQQQTRVDLALSEIAIIYKSLSTKRKYQPMKEALKTLKDLLEQQKKKGVHEIPREEIQKLLIPASNHLKSAKFHISMICFILKLINLKVLNDIQTTEDVLVYFLTIKDIQKEQLQLKLIQSFMTFIHPDFINFGNYGFVEKCLTMVLFMKTSKNPIINSSAETSLYKVIELLSASSQLIIANKGSSFDNMSIEMDLEDSQMKQSQKPQSQQEHNTEINKQVSSLWNILNDLIQIIDFVKPSWFPANVPLDREFGLVSLNSFLTNMGKFFLEFKIILELLQVSLVNNLKKLVNTPHNMIKTSIVVETYKCFIVLVDMAPLEFIEIWNIIISFIRSNEHSINRNLAFQSLIYFVQSQLFLETLIKLKFNEKNFLLDMISLFSGLSKDTNEGTENEWKRWCEFTNPTANLQGEQDVQCSDNALICRMLSEFLQRFANSLYVYADQKGIQLGKQITLEDPIFQQLIESTWKLNLRAAKYLLLKELDEFSLQNVLTTFQINFNIIGSFQMKQAQSALIKTLCEFCKPYGNEEFTKRHIQINKMVLNIANCLGNLLECNSWVCILKTFEQCENHYLRNRLAKNTSQEEQIKTLDITILFQSLDQLFTQSSTYENEHLISIMDAINQITIEYLEQMNDVDKKKQFDSKRFFSLSKLIELIKNNLHRLDLFWELIIAHFISVLSSRNHLLILSAIDTLSQIIFLGFEYLTQFYKKTNQQQSTFIKEKWSKEEAIYQYTLFQPWIDICALRQIEIKEILLTNILKMVQNNGHEIQNKGWDALLLILLSISAESTTIYVKSGLSCAEQIINQFLSNINQQQLTKLFDIIDNFKQNSNEQNINFQICNMLWHLGDFITKNHSSPKPQQLDNFLPKIFYKLSVISQDPITEIRHSAIHIFSNLLLHLNTDQLYQQWKKIIEQIFLEMLHKIVHIYQDKNAAKESDCSQWEETAKSVFQAFIKLAKKYFQIVDEFSENSDEDSLVIIQQILPDMILILQQHRPQLSLELAKELRELFQYKPSLCLQNFGPMLDQLSQMFNSPSSDMKYLKTLILHISNDILELICDILKTNFDLHIQKVIKIYYQILNFPIISHLKYDLIQNKIFFEDNLAPKNVMLAISISIQKSPNKLVECLISSIKQLLLDSPNDKFKHILIKRHLLQFNQLLSNNISIFFQFSELYETIISIMRVNESDLHYSDSLNEDKSIFMIMAETYLESAKKITISSQEIAEQLLNTIQTALPTKICFKKILGGLANTYKPFLLENIQIQDNYLEYIIQIYQENTKLCEKDIFIDFIKKLNDLAQVKSNSALTPIKLLCSLDLNRKVTLPYILDTSITVLERGESKLIIQLVKTLSIIRIPQNSFINFQTLDGDDKQISETSRIQSELGHLFYIMPQLAMCITHQDQEVREQIKEVLLLISQFI